MNHLQLSQEEIDFLKKYNFHFVSNENGYDEEALKRMPPQWSYVSGYIGRNHPEFYNKKSIDALILEIKTKNGILDDKTNFHYKNIEGEFYEIDSSKIQFIEQRINKDTGEYEIREPIRTAFAPYQRLIINETDEYVDVVGRYHGDFGDGSQYSTRVYKTKQACEAVLIPLLNKQIGEFTQRIDCLHALIQKYTNKK